MLRDSLGNPVHLQDPASLSAVNDFVGGFIACETRAVNVLAVADTDRSALVQAYSAALHMFSESRCGPANARPFIDAALAGASTASPRERNFVAAVEAWVHGDIPRAIRLHEQQAREFPRDLVSVKLGQYHLFNQGDAPGMLRLALTALPHAGDVAYMHGMAAFGWEQCHLLEQAEQAARKAITMNRKEPWAQHALAHVMLTQGRLDEGLQFMQHSSARWSGLNSFMVTHNWWHLALFALDLGQHDTVLRLYDQQVWGVVKEYSQDQIGAVSLLARLELAGVDIGDRWQELADYLTTRTHDQVLPFLDLQYLYGLARAGRPEADLLMANIQAFCTSACFDTPDATGSARQKNFTITADGAAADVWQHVCVPAGRGLLAHARGDYAAAVEMLGSALPRLMEIGGSHAQRDLFEQIHLDALIRSGRWSAAQQAVQQRLRGQPESIRLRRQARRVYVALGLDGIGGA
ncbi:MAG: tetratricopeptide repeat protein [Rhodoferax sp.]|nr:tetratricopeptide repeat protein [Rhodoferax sp.]